MAANLDSNGSILSLAPGVRLPHSSHHFVEYYKEHSSLIDSVARFISIGIGRGEAAVIIATEAHRRALEKALGELDVDVEALTDQLVYYAFDAAETLELFMVNGLPDKDKFDRIFGSIVDRARGSGRNIRIFGEMVAELWAQNNPTGALRLEDLWNELVRAHPFKLFCAYPVDGFAGENRAPLRSVSQKHTHVVAAQGAAL
jgi:hypothetical protein